MILLHVSGSKIWRLIHLRGTRMSRRVNWLGMRFRSYRTSVVVTLIALSCDPARLLLLRGVINVLAEHAAPLDVRVRMTSRDFR